MKNERIRVFELAKELGVAIGDIQFALETLRLPTRQQSTGWISGQHAEMVRRGLRQGAWRPRSRRRDAQVRQLITRGPVRPPRPTPVRCVCCETWFQVTVDENPAQRICRDCVDHQIGEGETETDSNRADRLEIHLAKLRSWNNQLHEKNTAMDAERQDAFRTRNNWRRALVEVMRQGHVLDDSDPENRCLCGAPFPCVTRRLLPSVNPGIASEVERFEAMHDRRREKELSGDKWTADDEYTYQMELRQSDVDKAS